MNEVHISHIRSPRHKFGWHEGIKLRPWSTNVVLQDLAVDGEVCDSVETTGDNDYNECWRIHINDHIRRTFGCYLVIDPLKEEMDNMTVCPFERHMFFHNEGRKYGQRTDDVILKLQTQK